MGALQELTRNRSVPYGAAEFPCVSPGFDSGIASLPQLNQRLGGLPGTGAAASAATAGEAASPGESSAAKATATG